MAGLTLSACGGAGPEGQSLPAASADATSDRTATPSASAESTAAPTSSASPEASDGASAEAELPAAATKHTAKGAEAFVRHWIDVANKAISGGDLDMWRSLGANSCKTCAARAKDVEDAYAKGGRIAGGQLSVSDLLPSPLEKGETPLVVADLKAAAEMRYDSADKLLDTFPAERIKLVFLMSWTGDRWSISEIKLGVP